MENYYEGMFLLHSSKFAADPEGVSQQVLDILEKAGAQVQAHRPWQDGKLAYPIQGHRKGLHYLTYFTMDGDRIKEVDRGCKLNDLILRHLVVKQPKVLYDKMVAALQDYGSQAEEESEGDESSNEDSGGQ